MHGMSCEGTMNDSRTPCASILLRIFNGPTTAEMAGDPPPYKQGLYQSTQFSKPSTYEEYLYHFVFKERKSFTVRDRLLGLENLPNSAKQTENSLIAWINMQLSKPIADGLDLSYIVKYDPSYGFKLSIDCAFNLETDGFTIAVTSLSSIPFLLEQELPDKRYPNDLMYTKSIDYQSQIRNPKWNDGFVWYRKRPLDMETVAVIELFTISLNNGEPEISENGWTIFNPFLSNGYARHGRFRLPLFNGSPNGKAVSFYRRQDPENCLDEALKQGFARLTSNVGSIIVRSCDGRRADEVPLDFDLSNIFLGEKSSLFRGAGWSQKPIQSLVKNMDPSDFDRKIYEIFTDVTNLPFIP
ncbi:hypothetical protein EDD86DRAFT_140288 [Gorgonomyces haynaldii]|nr:hypothetical protein EDD86DRAFT_140288 [Gorgonomyces haynaldii]